MSNMNQNEPPFQYNALCKTDVLESELFTFVWVISKFSSLTEEQGEEIKSEEFTIKGPGDKITKWFAKLYPRGQIDEDHVAIFLCKAKNIAEDVYAKCIISSLDNRRSKREIFTLDVKKFAESAWGKHKAFARNEMSEYTQDDTLTLIFDLNVVGTAKKSIMLAQSTEEKDALAQNYHYKKLVVESKCQSKLLQDLNSIFTTQHHTDVTVSCEDKEFQCHKNILTSRSSVFKTMLESNMKEKESGRVEIKDMNLEVFEDMLRYIYTSEAPNIDKHPEKLFAVADQYELQELKELCEVKLCSKLDLANCIDLLVLGDLHRASALKNVALKFVSKNIHHIETNEWKQTMISYPTLMAEVFEMVLPSKKNSDEEDKKRTAFS